jgi:LysM repeat protein
MITYVVKQGDTLSGIAEKFSVGLAALEAANPQIPDFNLIFPGQVIHIPVGPFPPPGSYVVQPGDTLTAIAELFSVTLAALEAANPQITNPDLIFPGQVIHIPGGVQTYVVQPGDTLSGIAKKFGEPLGEIEKANPQIPDFNLIFPGQVIVIP